MKILMIGNGFDLEHYLPTKYTQFLEFVKKYRYAYLSANSVHKRLYDINDIVKFEVGFTDIKETCNLECVKGEKTWI